MTAIRDARRLSIMSSAERVLQCAGPAGMKLRDVAREAGVAPGTIYFYFSSKEELMATILTTRIDGIRAALLELDGSEAPLLPVEFLGATMPHISALFRDFEQGLEEWTRAPSEVVAPAITESLRETFIALVTQLASQFSAAAQAAGDEIDRSPESAQFIWTVLIGMAQQEVNDIHSSFGTTPVGFVAVAAKALVAGLRSNRVSKTEMGNR